jgi:hypothetical protein
MGPVIELFNVRIIRDKVKAIAGSGDQVHVLLASTDLDQVIEIVVEPGGMVERRIVLEDTSPSYVDLAYDRQKRLHLLIEQKHMVFQGGVWQESDQTPWQDFDLKIGSPHFVPGAPHLVWMFQVDGKDVGTPWRMDIYGVGGYGGAIIWPWVTHGVRTVMTAESAEGYGPLLVLEPDKKENAVAVGAASDCEGNVTVVYNFSRGGIASNPHSLFHAQIDSEIFFDDPEGSPDMTQTQEKTFRIRPIEGKSLFDNQTTFPYAAKPFSCSADPGSGMALLGLRWFIHGGSVTGPLDTPVPGIILEARTTPGGNDSFHALVVGSSPDWWSGGDWPIQYLFFSGNEWSAPVEVGVANQDSFWGWIWEAVDIVEVDSGRVFLVWPIKNGIVGRWIEHIE